MVRQLSDARQMAGVLDLPEIGNLIEMAILGVVAKWEGVDPDTTGDGKLEIVTRLRLREAEARRYGAPVRRIEDWKGAALPIRPSGPKRGK